MSYKYRKAFRDTLCLASDARNLSASRRKITFRRQSRFSETSLQVPLSLGAPGTSHGPVGLLWTAASLRRMSCVKAGQWRPRKGSSSGSASMSRRVSHGAGWRRCLRERLEMAWKRRQPTWRTESGRSCSSTDGGLRFGGGVGLFPVIVRKSTAVTEVDEVSDASERMMSCSPTSMATFLREELQQSREPPQVATPSGDDDGERGSEEGGEEEEKKTIDCGEMT